MRRTYTYGEVATVLQAVVGDPIGEAVTPRVLWRKGGDREGRSTRGRIRWTAAMPAPVVDEPRALFDADEIDAWARKHPKLERWTALQQLAVEAAGSASERARGVQRARAAGLSWADIAEVLGRVDGCPITRQGVAYKYG